MRLSSGVAISPVVLDKCTRKYGSMPSAVHRQPSATPVLSHVQTVSPILANRNTMKPLGIRSIMSTVHKRPLSLKMGTNLRALNVQAIGTPPRSESSPNLEIEGGLPALIAACSVRVPRFYSADGYCAEKIEVNKETSDAIENIDRLMRRPECLVGLDPDVIKQLVALVSEWIFEAPPEVPRQFVECDSVLDISLATGPVYSRIFGIMTSVLMFWERAMIQEWATDKVIMGLVRCWDSPGEHERNAVNAMISELCERIPVKARVFDMVLRRLELVHCGMAPCTFVGSALFFIVSSENDFRGFAVTEEQFVKSVLPLFKSMFLPSFIFSLSRVAMIYYSYFDELPRAAIVYLFRHWPLTDSSKITGFTQHLMVLVRLFGDDDVKKFVEPIFRRIAGCVESVNYKVALAGMQPLCDYGFMCRFAPVVDIVVPIIVRAVKAKQGYWHTEVANHATIALSAIKRLGWDGRLEENPLDQTQGDVWKMLLDSVDDKMIDSEAIDRVFGHTFE